MGHVVNRDAIASFTAASSIVEEKRKNWIDIAPYLKIFQVAVSDMKTLFITIPNLDYLQFLLGIKVVGFFFKLKLVAMTIKTIK